VSNAIYRLDLFRFLSLVAPFVSTLQALVGAAVSAGPEPAGVTRRAIDTDKNARAISVA